MQKKNRMFEKDDKSLSCSVTFNRRCQKKKETGKRNHKDECCLCMHLHLHIEHEWNSRSHTLSIKVENKISSEPGTGWASKKIRIRNLHHATGPQNVRKQGREEGAEGVQGHTPSDLGRKLKE